MIQALKRAVPVVALVLMVVVGCTADGGDRDGSHSHDDHSHELGPDMASPAEDVAAAWLQTIYAWEPVSDESPTDALIRGRKWAAGALADPGPVVGEVRSTVPEWDAWRRSKDTLSASVSNIDVVAVTAHRAVVTAVVTQSVLHSDGDLTPFDKLDVTVTLEKSDQNQWKVLDYRQLPSSTEIEGEK